MGVKDTGILSDVSLQSKGVQSWRFAHQAAFSNRTLESPAKFGSAGTGACETLRVLL